MIWQESVGAKTEKLHSRKEIGFASRLYISIPHYIKNLHGAFYKTRQPQIPENLDEKNMFSFNDGWQKTYKKGHVLTMVLLFCFFFIDVVDNA